MLISKHFYLNPQAYSSLSIRSVQNRRNKNSTPEYRVKTPRINNAADVVN